MNARTATIVYAVLIFLIVGTAILGYFLIQHGKSQVPPSQDITNLTSIERLYVVGPDNEFLLANQVLNSSPTEAYSSEAIPLFERLLPAEDPEQEAHIKYKLALAHTYANPAKAIELLKEIVSNQSYPNQQKAFAVEHMYRMYAEFLLDDSLLPLIFSGDPYASFYTEGNKVVALRKLNEYALSFGDAPISATTIATTDATMFLKQPYDASNTSHVAQVEKIQGYLAQAERYVQENSESKNNVRQVASISTNIAHIYGYLAVAGLDPYKQQYAEKFRKAIALGGIQGSATARNNYAWFSLLLNDEATWNNEAKPLFHEMIENMDRYATMEKWYRLMKNDTPQRKERLIFMAENDPVFKELLLSLGWEASDFSPSA